MIQRKTWQRERIRDGLAAAGGFISAQALYARLRENDTGVGLATVYRALNDMSESGDADSLQGPDGQALFRACSHKHHHHLICRACGATEEIDAPPVERWARKTAEIHAYSDAQHVVDIFGVCPSCTSEAPAK